MEDVTNKVTDQDKIEIKSVFGDCYVLRNEIHMQDGCLVIPVHSNRLTALTAYDTREAIIKIASDEYRMYNPSFHWDETREQRENEFVLTYRIKPT